MTATADLPNKNIKNFTEKFNFAAGDKSIIVDSEDGDKIKLIAKTLMKGDTGATPTSAAIVGDDIVFTKDDGNTVTITGAVTTLKGEDGREIELQTTATYIQWRYVGDVSWANLISIAAITGPAGACVESVSFVGDDMVFVLEDSSTVTIIGAKTTLKGDPGTPGTDGADGASFVREGVYSAGTTYQVNDAVSYNGSSYICILESTGNLPTNATYWSLMAAKGTDGEGSGDMLAATYDPTSVAGDAFDMDNMAQGDTKKYVSASDITNLGNLSGTNTGDETQSTIKTKLGAASTSTDGYLTSTDWNTFNGKQSALSKATGAEVDTGTDDSKYVTSKAMKDSSYMKNPMTTAGDIIYGGTSGAPTRLAKGTAGQVLKMNSGATAPEWGEGGGVIVKTIMPTPHYISDGVANATISGNTTLNLSLISLPFGIQLNKISFYAAIGTSGTVKFVLYSEDGQTKVFEKESGTLSTNDVYTITLNSSINISAGNYYLGILAVSTTNITIRVFLDDTATDLLFSESGLPVLSGQVTVTADTIPSTITPTSITGAASKCIVCRLDN